MMIIKILFCYPNSISTDILIVGCTHAGTICACAIRQFNPNTTITVIERNATVSFLSCGICLSIEGITIPEKLFYNTVPNLKAHEINILTSTNVCAIDFTKRVITHHPINQINNKVQMAYGKIILATGSTPICPKFSILADQFQDKVMLVKNYDHLQKILETLKQPSSQQKRFAVIGGGLVGLEIAEALAKNGCHTELIEQSTTIFQDTLDSKIAQQVQELMIQNGVKLHLGKHVKDIFLDQQKELIIQCNDDQLQADNALICLGVKPNTELLRDSGIKMLLNGSIIVNEHSETNLENVYAVGDCVAQTDYFTNDNIYQPFLQNAMMNSLVAATHISGNDKYSNQSIIGTRSLKCFNYNISLTGLSYAKAMQIDKLSKQVSQKYDKMKQNILMLVIFGQNDRVYGVQIMTTSNDSVVEIANLASFCIQQKMTLQEIVLLDLPGINGFHLLQQICLHAVNSSVQ